MTKLFISVAVALAVATSVEAMSPAPLHEPDSMITEVRKAGQCDDPTGTSQWCLRGLCPTCLPSRTRVLAWNEGFCIEYYGTLKPCGPEVRC